MNFFKINGCTPVSAHFKDYIVGSLSWIIHYILKAKSRGNLRALHHQSQKYEASGKSPTMGIRIAEGFFRRLWGKGTNLCNISG